MQPRYIFDCDVGADDALALMLALKGGLNVVAVTTAAGNAPAAVCAQNALGVLALCGREDIPVYVGAAQPLARPLAFDGVYSGPGGMNGITLPHTAQPVAGVPAYEAILHACAAGPVHILSTAPMTNLALALQSRPEVAQSITRITTSNGGYGVAPGVALTRCEWNIAVDPEAAELVLTSGIEVLAAGLDVSLALHNAMIPPLLAAAAADTPIGRFFRRAVAFNEQCEWLEPFSLLVDALAPALALAPGLALETVRGAVAFHLPPGQPPLPGCMPLVLGPGPVTAAARFDFDGYLALLARVLFA